MLRPSGVHQCLVAVVAEQIPVILESNPEIETEEHFMKSKSTTLDCHPRQIVHPPPSLVRELSMRFGVSR